ncbi:MAG: ATP-binding cassette domain-containing protein [Terriglobia bacterium]
MNDIEVQKITKRFGDFTAVSEVSFQVAHGEIFGLLGPNGAGKSTLIRMMNTLVTPTSGSAMVNGFDVVRSANEVRKSIGVIPQAQTSDQMLSAEENMLIFARLYGVKGDKRTRIIRELLEAVQLTEWAKKPVGTFSGGMRRRLEIARGLVHEPKIFFLDEPTTGLDPVSRVAVWEMLDRLKREHDMTVLVTTHYMDEADKLCNRVAIVDHGKLVALDSPMKLKASISGSNTLEVSFDRVPEGWLDTLKGLPDVLSVTASDHVFRITTRNGPLTTVKLLDAARQARAGVASLSVQSATLDDVFVHYTGRQLRDAAAESAVYDVSHMYGGR